MSSVFVQWLANARVAYARRRAIETLSQLSDSQLLDVGLERGTIEDHVNEGLPWRAWDADPARPSRAFVQGCG